jgi:hypothetical protein
MNRNTPVYTTDILILNIRSPNIRYLFISTIKARRLPVIIISITIIRDYISLTRDYKMLYNIPNHINIYCRPRTCERLNFYRKGQDGNAVRDIKYNFYISSFHITLGARRHCNNNFLDSRCKKI